jgi:hypothetical protein
LQIKLTSFLACLQFLVFYKHSMVASASKVFSKGVQQARQEVLGPHRSRDSALSSGESVRSEQARGGGIPHPRCLIGLAVTMQGIQYQHILPLSLFRNREPEITAHELLGNERKLH